MKPMFVLAPLAVLVAAPVAAQVMTPAKYVATAGASDLYERQSSQVVLESTTDPKVRSFATMMVSAHAKTTASVKAAAAKSHVTAPPPMLNAAQTEMIAQLKAENGAARDAAYIAQQKAAHGQALAVQQAYAKEGTAPALRTAASGVVPVVQNHIKMLMTM